MEHPRPLNSPGYRNHYALIEPCRAKGTRSQKPISYRGEPGSREPRSHKQIPPLVVSVVRSGRQAHHARGRQVLLFPARSLDFAERRAKSDACFCSSARILTRIASAPHRSVPLPPRSGRWIVPTNSTLPSWGCGVNEWYRLTLGFRRVQDRWSWCDRTRRLTTRRRLCCNNQLAATLDFQAL